MSVFQTHCTISKHHHCTIFVNITTNLIRKSLCIDSPLMAVNTKVYVKYQFFQDSDFYLEVEFYYWEQNGYFLEMADLLSSFSRQRLPRYPHLNNHCQLCFNVRWCSMKKSWLVQLTTQRTTQVLFLTADIVFFSALEVFCVCLPFYHTK